MKRVFKPLLFPTQTVEGLARISFPGFTMYVDPKDTMGDMALGGAWEAATSHVFREVIKPGDVVIDVGAHWGYFTLLAASLCTHSGVVYAFEPHPRNFAMLTKNVAANQLSNVVAVQKAVSDRAGETLLFEARGAGGHSLNPLPAQWRVNEGTVPQSTLVTSTSLDDFFRGRPIQPKLTKMDIEGSEPRAVEGMLDLIVQNPQMVLIAEVNPLYLDREASIGFVEKLASLGFEMVVINEERRQLEFASTAELLNRFRKDRALEEINLLCTRSAEVMQLLLGTEQRRPGQIQIVSVRDKNRTS